MIKAVISAHLTYDDALLTAKRIIGDTHADAFINKTFEDAEKKQQLQSWISGLNNNGQLTELPEAIAAKHLFCKADQLPLWANRRLMQTGAACP